MLLNKQQLLVHHAASKDSARPVLEQVCVRVDKKTKEVIAVSTDSYILAEVRCKPMGEDSDFPDVGQPPKGGKVQDIFIEAPAVKKALSTLPTGKKAGLPILENALVQKDQITTTDLSHTNKFHVRAPEGKFPDYEKLIPTEEPKATVTLNPALLKRLLDVAKDDHSVTLEIYGKLEPVVMRTTNEGNKKTLIIMPLKT